jgi:hypothetical protein
MTTTQQPERDRKCNKEDAAGLKARIGALVMHTLGKPDDLRGVQVRHLWGDHFRVNVLTGADLASSRVAHSYFLVADRDGNIVASTPALVRRYQQEGERGPLTDPRETAGQP